MTGFRSLARNHDFTVLWTGELVSQLGSQMSMLVFPLVGYALTGSAALAGLVPGAFVLGMLLALLPAGVVADRVDRRLVLRVASGAGAVLYASLAAAGLTGRLTLAHLLVVALLTGVAAALHGPAEMSAVRSVVAEQDLPAALSQNQARQHVGALLGAPLGGLLYGLGRAVPFCFDAVSYLVSFLAVSRLRTDLSPEPGPRRRPWRDVTAGLAYVVRRPYFRASMAFAATSNLVINAVFFVATMRLVQQGVPAATIGVVDALAGAGGIIGALIAPWLIARLRRTFGDGRRVVVGAADRAAALLVLAGAGRRAALLRRAAQPGRQRRQPVLPDADHARRPAGPDRVGHPVRGDERDAAGRTARRVAARPVRRRRRHARTADRVRRVSAHPHALPLGAQHPAPARLAGPAGRFAA